MQHLYIEKKRILWFFSHWEERGKKIWLLILIIVRSSWRKCNYLKSTHMAESRKLTSLQSRRRIKSKDLHCSDLGTEIFSAKAKGKRLYRGSHIKHYSFYYAALSIVSESCTVPIDCNIESQYINRYRCKTQTVSSHSLSLAKDYLLLWPWILRNRSITCSNWDKRNIREDSFDFIWKDDALLMLAD